MKIIEYFIGILILNSILSIDHKMISGVEKVIKYPYQNREYNFYINVTQYQMANFSIITDKIDNHGLYNYISNIYVDEYSSKGIKKDSKYQHNNKNSFINNEFICSFTNSMGHNNVTKYIALRFMPHLNFKYLKVKIDVEGGAFDLFNGVAKKIDNLRKDFPYYLFIPASQFQNVSFNLTMNYMANKPFNNLHLYEYEDRNLSGIYSKLERIGISSKNDKLISSFSYMPSHSYTKYIALEIIPNENITYLTATIDITGGAYTINRDLTYISDLEAGESYYFLLSYSIYINSTINLTMNYNDNIPFSEIEIYESPSFSTIGNLHATTTKNASLSIENDKLTTSFKYAVNQSETNYIALKIKPDYSIKDLLIKIDEVQLKYSIYDKCYVYNLASENKYYLSIRPNVHKIKVTLTMNNVNYLSSLTIYEIRSGNIRKYDNKIVKSIDEIKISDSVISFSYILPYEDYFYWDFILELSLNHDIDKIFSEIEYPLYLTTGKIVLIVLVCVFIIIAIIVIIIIIKKCRKNKNSNVLETPSEPLYPENGSSQPKNQQLELDNITQE
jgi:hypothetical protein